MPLTPKQAAFVAAYVESGNGTQSAIKAGYAESSAHVTAHDLLRNPKIIAALTNVGATAIQRVQAATEDAVGTAEWIIRNAAETHREARADGQFGPAVAALNLLAKRIPEFRDNQPAPNQTLVLNGLNDEQLDAVIKRLSGG